MVASYISQQLHPASEFLISSNMLATEALWSCPNPSHIPEAGPLAFDLHQQS